MNMIWNFRKPIKNNFKETGLQFICYRNSNIFQPWMCDKLESHISYDIVGTKCISLFIDDEDKCPYLTPSGPPRCYFRTNVIIKPACKIELSCIFTENVPTKFISLRDTSDVEDDDAIALSRDEDGQVKYVVGHTEHSLARVELCQEFKVTLQLDCNDVLLTTKDKNLVFSVRDISSFWVNIGLVSSKSNTYNNLLITHLSIFS